MRRFAIVLSGDSMRRSDVGPQASGEEMPQHKLMAVVGASRLMGMIDRSSEGRGSPSELRVP